MYKLAELVYDVRQVPRKWPIKVIEEEKKSTVLNTRPKRKENHPHNIPSTLQIGRKRMHRKGSGLGFKGYRLGEIKALMVCKFKVSPVLTLKTIWFGTALNKFGPG